MLILKLIKICRSGYLVVVFFFSVIFFATAMSSQAYSFPFRALTVGKPVPDATFKSYRGDKAVSIHAKAGSPLLIVFWGGDLEAKKKRAVRSFQIIGKLQPYLKEKGVHVLVVNMQNDQQDVVDEVIAASGSDLPTYKDVSQEAYRSFGIYVLPSFLLIGADGNISGGIGYSKDLPQRLRDEVDVMLGLMTRQGLEADLNPDSREVPKEVRLARRHLQMGILMKHKGQTDGAVREFLKGLKIDPDLYEARVELGCLYLEKGDLDAAVRELEAGLEGKPDSVEAEICLARVSAEMGEVDEAIMDLQALLFRNSRNPQLQYDIGVLLDRQGKYKEAAHAYRKAFDLLQHRTAVQE